MRLNDMFPSPYLKSADFEEEEVKVVTIKDVSLEELTSKEGEKQTKPVLAFREKEVKPLVCNITNAKIIAGLYGEDSDEWIGKRVSLFVTQVDSFGKQVDAIRVRAKVPAAAKPAPKPAQPVGEAFQETDEWHEELDDDPFQPKTNTTAPTKMTANITNTETPVEVNLPPAPAIPSKQTSNGKRTLRFGQSTLYPALMSWAQKQGYYAVGDSSISYRLSNILLGAGVELFQDNAIDTYKQIVAAHYAKKQAA